MKQICTIIFLIVLLIAVGQSKPPLETDSTPEFDKILDSGKYINANNLLMMVTNVGVFATDLGGLFGKTDGLYFPYTSIADIENHINTKTVMYASGIWLGGIDNSNGDILVTVAEYSEEYNPGPMVDGTFYPNAFTDPVLRVYKLYKDSLANNPNTDYLEWPVAMGAPVDGSGNPVMKGEQLLWTVFNDADPSRHTNNSGKTEPLGIEIQQTVWESAPDGSDSTLVLLDIGVVQSGDSKAIVTVRYDDYNLLLGHDYTVETYMDYENNPVWDLIDNTIGGIILSNQPFSFFDEIYIDGFYIKVHLGGSFESFEVVSNAAGPIDPPEAGAMWWQDFPVPTDVDPDGYITENQQIGEGRWAVHTGDNGTRGSFDAFIARTFRGDATRLNNFGFYDWEIRFTGSNENPGVGGSYALQAFTNGIPFWVPYELWRIGVGTPDDPSDDLKLISWIFDDDGGGAGDDIFDLSAWGSVETTEGCGPGGCDHSGSGGINDPFTDWIYWKIPVDETPGTAGYDAFETVMLSDPDSWGYEEALVMDRMVLVNWNGGDHPSEFNQDMPEVGTVFRINSIKGISPDVFTFNTVNPYTYVTNNNSNAVYMEFKLYNKGGKDLRDCYVSVWADPDLGDAYDDLVGCDTVLNIGYCYNGDDDDGDYGSTPPAVGFKVIRGPLVETGNPSDSGYFENAILPGYKNIEMTAFAKYINGTDPQNKTESYNYMQGLKADGSFYYDNFGNLTKYHFTGDPVTGIGDIDVDPADRRLMLSMGPFDFAPGDSQYVKIKLGVGMGSDRLISITKLIEVLEQPEIYSTLKTEINPDRIYAYMSNTIEQKSVAVSLGNDASSINPDPINLTELNINNISEFDSIVTHPFLEGYEGEAYTVYLPLEDFIQGYGAFWDTTSAAYSVSVINHKVLIGHVTLIGKLTGDVNGDNVIGITDLTLLIDYLFNGIKIKNIENADINHDGAVNIIDLTMLINIIFGLE